MNKSLKVLTGVLLIVLFAVFLTACGGGGGGSGNGGGDGGTDTTPPSIPTGLTATAVSSGQIDLSWEASTDNVGVAGYKIYRDGDYLKSVTAISTNDTGLSANTQYCYTVSAYDAAGNESGQSVQVCAMTQTGGQTGTIQLPETGQTTSYYPRDDGDLQIGVTWPNPRFTDNGDGTIKDNLTGLMWLKDGNCYCFGTQTSQGTLDAAADFKTNPGKYYCQDYTATYNDWRLPNVNELESLIHAGKNTYLWLNNQAFVNVKSSGYWTSTYVYGYGAAFVDMWDGNVYYWYGEDVLPVRGTTTTLPKTGQTKCYNYITGLKTNCAGTGQDGEIQAGITWPTPRFTDNGDGTVTDNLAGLMWLKDASCLGAKKWYDALDRVADFNADPGRYNCVNYYTASYSDWRLPNRKELFNLIDFSRPGLSSGHPFVNVEDKYWSSTADSCGYFECYTWRVDMRNGIVYSKDMTNYGNVWPVRAE